MARGGTGNVVPSIVGAEHIGPEATGDNIEAKRVANYVWNGSTWERQGNGSGLVTASYDYVTISYPTDTTEVYVFKSGGSAGTTVSTVTLTYTDATKNSLSSVEKT